MREQFIKSLRNQYPNVDVDVIIQTFDEALEEARSYLEKPEENPELVFPLSCDFNMHLLVTVISRYQKKKPKAVLNIVNNNGNIQM